jgi:preprotein translocase subunit SecF
MLVGIVVGSYSTIYIASPIVLWLQHAFAGGDEPARVGRSPQPA